jgi:hypothetical protein
MVRDGHWRTIGEEGERGAWEESVRLREGMFWARIGGGVVPAFIQARDSPRSSSTEERPSDEVFDRPLTRILRGKSSDLSTVSDKRVSFSEGIFTPKDLDAVNASNESARGGSAKVMATVAAPKPGPEESATDQTVINIAKEVTKDLHPVTAPEELVSQEPLSRPSSQERLTIITIPLHRRHHNYSSSSVAPLLFQVLHCIALARSLHTSTVSLRWNDRSTQH